MKKFLSLVLALVMTMSLVTITAGAKDFTDSSKVNYNEAVDVVSTCKIVDGYTDGAFNPQNTLTRGAAAKIICNMVLGPTTAAALGVDAKPFKDVAVDNVFAGYIAYCAKQGIINGYADGTFRPAGLVTGNQFMKMLLGALGYDGKIEGFTGANWTVNVMKLAKNISLDDGLTETFVGSKAMNREEACLYAFNTLKATMVEYDSQTNITIGGTQVTVGNTKAKDMANTTNSDGKIKGDELMQFAEKYFTDLKKTGNNADDFGRPANEWQYKSTTIGTYADSGNLIGTYTKKVTKGDLYTLVGKDAISDINKSVKDATKNTLNAYVDGKPIVDSTAVGYGDARDAAVKSLFSKNSSAAAGVSDAALSGKGVLTEVYMDDDNNVTVVEINTYVVKASEDYSTKNENVQTEAAGDTEALLDPKKIDYKLSQDDFDVKSVKENDYLLITIAQNDGNNYDVKSVTPAKMVEGKVTSYSTTSNVTVGGTKYDYAKMTANPGVQSTNFKIDENAKIVLDSYGYIIAVDDATVSSGKYVFIQDTDVSGLKDTVTAAAYFTDGTYKEITVKKVNDSSDMTTGATVSGKANFGAGWYTYSVDSNGKYSLTGMPTDSKFGAHKAFSSNASTHASAPVMTNGTSGLNATIDINSSNKDIKANNSTVVITLNSDDDTSVYTGVNKMPTIKTGSKTVGSTTTNDPAIDVYYVTKDTGYATLVFVDMSAAKNASTDDATDSTDTYAFILDQDSTNKDAKDNEYYTYNAIVDGKETTINLDDTTTEYTLYTTLKKNSDGYIAVSSMKKVADKTDGKYAKANLDKAADPTKENVAYTDGVLTLGGTDYTVTSATKIYLVVKGDTNNDAIKGIMSDDDATYETYIGITATTLKNTLKGYTVSGNYIGVRTDSNSSTMSLSELYVYVSDAAVLHA